MHWLAQAAAAVFTATVLSSCSTAPTGTPVSKASGDGPEIVVLRPVDAEGKLVKDWNVRPVRGNAEMSCTKATASPYAVDPGVVTGCAPNPDNAFACWIVEKRPGTVCLAAPFNPKNRLVVQFPSAPHGAPTAPPASPIPVALELDDGTLCAPVEDSRYRCGTSTDVERDSDEGWKVLAGKRQVAKEYYLGIAEDRVNLALEAGAISSW